MWDTFVPIRAPMTTQHRSFRLTFVWLFSALLCYGHAQVVESHRLINACPEFQRGKSIKDYGPFCHEDNVVAFQFVGYSSDLKGKSFWGYQYDLAAGRCAKAVELNVGITPGSRGAVADVIVVGEEAIVVYYSMSKKEFEITVYGQRFSLKDLTPVGEATIISKGQLRSFSGEDPKLYVVGSPDNDKVAVIGRTNLVAAEGAVALCWVFDNELAPIWNGRHAIAKEHPQASPFQDVQLSPDGALIFEGVHWNGKLNKTPEESTSLKLVKVHSDKRTEWDLSLGGGKLLGGMAVLYGPVKNLVGGFVTTEDQKGKIAEWAIVELNENLEPSILLKGRLTGAGYERIFSSTLISDGEDGYFLSSRLDEDIVILSISAKGDVRWKKVMRAKGLPYAFQRGGSLHFAMMAHASDIRSLEANKGYELAGFQRQPVLLSFDSDGKMTITELVPASEGGTRDVINEGFPPFSTLERCGLFLDRSHATGKPGLVYGRMR